MNKRPLVLCPRQSILRTFVTTAIHEKGHEVIRSISNLLKAGIEMAQSKICTIVIERNQAGPSLADT
jgi:hypothetical protein